MSERVDRTSDPVPFTEEETVPAGKAKACWACGGAVDEDGVCLRKCSEKRVDREDDAE